MIEKRKPLIYFSYALVPLTRGMYSIIDIEDVEKVSRHNWCTAERKNTFYASASIDGESVGMHRFLFGLRDRSQQVDHIDHDGLNNRRENLRLCTHAENMRNRLPHRRKKSPTKYKGVHFNPDGKNKWSAHIFVEEQLISLGSFSSEVEAALTYDDAAIKCFGEFAYLNFPSYSVLIQALRKENENL